MLRDDPLPDAELPAPCRKLLWLCDAPELREPADPLRLLDSERALPAEPLLLDALRDELVVLH